MRGDRLPNQKSLLFGTTFELDLVERKTLEIGKRGISGAKIVHRDPDTKCSQLVKHGKCRFLVVQQDGLGNFDLQPCRIQARGSECPNDDLHQAGIAELNRRNIDGDTEMSWPSGCGDTCLPDYPLSDRDDKADLFRQWNECGRRNYSTFRMIPADQGLESADIAVRQIYHRLVVEFELAGGQCLAQVLFHDATGLHLQVHRGLEKPECATSIAFRPV